MELGKQRAVLFLIICLGFVWSIESTRTHERFSQSSYYSSPDASLSTETPVEVNPSTSTIDPNSVPGVESKEESKKDFVAVQVKQNEDDKPQQYFERGGNYASTGDFTADARPWWFNPQYSNYGNQPTDRNPSTSDPRYFNNFERPRETPSQYDRSQRNYAQNMKTNDADFMPVDDQTTGGGCPTQYWISNTHSWPTFFNVKSTIGDAFGTPAAKVYGETTILQALLDTHDDGYHSLGRNGCTAILNAYSRPQYKFSHQMVIENFNAALVSNKAAARQAAMFDEANLRSLSGQSDSCP
ncbi:hypothetical protein AXG93_1862s1240 [Marchantia polymorpha subsp. ruderalis]|uniref:Uncharacterized protein n=1 Tax=Marchantia polymorpha subsp. ruderalis TaxID=1480154 RepID=A0A176W7X5_MARPO|nr:hypothetical protein AXG93_1862s1240 [Marchantia polymorpha subsp. ruderalis]